jgi:hypothetical protein
VVTKLDRLARSLPDARDILDELTKRNVKLSLGGSIHDPTDPVGRSLFNVLAMVAEFESDLIRLRTREGMKVAKAKGRLRGKQPKLKPNQAKHLLELHDSGTYTQAELAELFGVGRGEEIEGVVGAARQPPELDRPGRLPPLERLPPRLEVLVHAAGGHIQWVVDQAGEDGPPAGLLRRPKLLKLRHRGRPLHQPVMEHRSGWMNKRL